MDAKINRNVFNIPSCSGFVKLRTKRSSLGLGVAEESRVRQLNDETIIGMSVHQQFPAPYIPMDDSVLLLKPME